MSIPLTVEDACFRLQSYQSLQGFSHYQARLFLQSRWLNYRLLELYQALFPQQFESSQVSLYPKPDGHSDRELEFLLLLNEHCFPLPEWILDEGSDAQEVEAIPILDMGVTWQSEGNVEELRDGWQILLPLTHDWRSWVASIDPRYAEYYECHFDITVDSIRHPSQLNPKEVRQRFRISPTHPLWYVPLCLRVLDKVTGNLWLDQYEEEVMGYCKYVDWSLDSVRSLTRQWRQAQSILKHCYRLITWLEEDLTANFEQILKRWNQT